LWWKVRGQEDARYNVWKLFPCRQYCENFEDKRMPYIGLRKTYFCGSYNFTEGHKKTNANKKKKKKTGHLYLLYSCSLIGREIQGML
jgi:hypothetical protein